MPYWITNELNRRGESLDACLSIPRLKEILSVNDIALLQTLNEEASKVFGNDKRGNNISTCLNLFNCVSQDFDSNREQDMLRKLSNSEWAIQELNSRLFNIDAKEDSYEKPFISTDINAEYVVITIYPGFFVSKANSALQLSIVEEVLRVLYVYNTYDIVARTQYFKRYLELL